MLCILYSVAPFPHPRRKFLMLSCIRYVSIVLEPSYYIKLPVVSSYTKPVKYVTLRNLIKPRSKTCNNIVLKIKHVIKGFTNNNRLFATFFLIYGKLPLFVVTYVMFCHYPLLSPLVYKNKLHSLMNSSSETRTLGYIYLTTHNLLLYNTDINFLF